MRLPIFRQMSYISPSTFLTWRKCQYKIYLSKQSGFTYEQQPQSIYAQVGTAFDAFIKEKIARTRNIRSPILNLDRMLKGCTQEAIDVGIRLAKQFILCKTLFEPLINAPEIYIEQEVHRIVGGVPLLGRIDLIVNGVPLDFKVRGYKSKNTVSPTSGYIGKYVWYGEPHNQWVNREPNLIPGQLEFSNEDWAVQCYIYCCIVCHLPAVGWIYELCIQPDESLIIVEHNNELSENFMNRIRKELEEMWDKLTDHFYFSHIQEPIPSVRICEAYKTLCDVAHLCKFYKETLGDKERRAAYV